MEAGPPLLPSIDLNRIFPEIAGLHPADSRRFFFTRVFVERELASRCDDLVEIIRRWQPDVVAHEVAELASPLAATAAGIPYVTVGFGPLLQPEVAFAAGASTAPFWRFRGLDPPPSAGLYRHLYLDPCPPSLQIPQIAGIANVSGVRITPAPAERPSPPGWASEIADQPTVYVTFGTRYSDLRHFRVVIDALVSEGLNLIVTVGPGIDPGDLGPVPGQVRIERFIPQERILGLCSAVIAHGGAGTVLGALAFGKPLLLLPQGADQFYNAERVVAAGAGLSLAGPPEAEAVRSGTLALLAGNHFQRAAESVAAEFLAMPSPGDAVHRIEEVVRGA